VGGIFKVIFIGEGGVGKTSLLRRATQGGFDSHMALTVGVDFAVYDVTYNSWEATLQLWDLGGQVRFRKLVFQFFDGAHLALAVFDVSSRFTMFQLQEWIKRLHQSEGEVPLVVVGNKIDLRDLMPSSYPIISGEEGREFAMRYGAPYVETSAKDGRGIEEMFLEVSRILAERYPSPPGSLEFLKLRKTEAEPTS